MKNNVVFILSIVTMTEHVKHMREDGSFTCNLWDAAKFKTRAQAKKETLKHETCFRVSPYRDLGHNLYIPLIL